MARVRGEVRSQTMPKRRPSDACGSGSRTTGRVGHHAVAASGAIETPTPRPTSIAMAANELISKRSRGTMPVRRSQLSAACLDTLDAVLRGGSLAAAASETNLTASAVSMQMKQLEAYLGQPLFDRSGHAIRPTPLGDAMTAALANTLRTLAGR